MLTSDDINVYTLYKETKNYFTTTAEFIEALDCLFALGAIALLKKNNTEVLHYAL